MAEMKMFVEKFSFIDHDTGKVVIEHVCDPPIEYKYVSENGKAMKFILADIPAGTYDLDDWTTCPK